MENSNNNVLLYGIVGLIVGVVLTIIIARATSNNDNSAMMRMMGYQRPAQMMQQDVKPGPNDHMHSAMEGMMMGLGDKTGDEFDQAFLSEMIVHHEGAVWMAQEALTNSNREEIKNMAKAIIEAQTTEIKQMRDWQAAWYK